MKVLIVDNDLLVCKGLKQLVPWEKLGFHSILDANNGDEAYELAMRYDPDLILSDISMPLMNGLELCKKIRTVMIETPIILLSAYDDFEYAQTAITYGVSSYLLKPINKLKIQKLIQLIDSITTQKKEKADYYWRLFGGDIQQNILNALKNLDSEFIIDFFDNKIKNISIANKDKKIIYIGLINIMYKYFDDIGFKMSAIISSKEKALEKVIRMNNTQEIENYVQQMYIDVIQQAITKKSNNKEPIIEDIKKYIKDNYNKEILSVSLLSQNFNISSSYLSYTFKLSMGVNPSVYITHIRIKNACELLKVPHTKVSDVAEAVGYHDSLYFSKVFKKIIGITPSEYHNLNVS